MSTFFKTLIELTETEAAAEAAESEQLTSVVSYSKLEKIGVCLSGLTVCGVTRRFGHVLLELQPSLSIYADSVLPPHQLRTGAAAIVIAQTAQRKGSKASSTAPPQAINVVVYRSTKTKLIVSLGGENNEAEDIVSGKQLVRVVKTGDVNTLKRQLKFLEQMLRTVEAETALPDLFSVLLGDRAPAFNASPSEPLVFKSLTLNKPQQDAVRFAVHDAIDLALIWGPPGTGKTQTLAEIVWQFVQQGKRVLICGGSNLSVDNLLERLGGGTAKPAMRRKKPLTLEDDVQLQLTRIGHPARVLAKLSDYTLDTRVAQSESTDLVSDIKSEITAIHSSLKAKGKGERIRGSERKEKWTEAKELEKERRTREASALKDILVGTNVVFATTHGAGGKEIQGQEFDVLIIDEAAQVTEPACWVPLVASKAKKLILAGDHLQLPPTIKSLEPKLKGNKRNKRRTVSVQKATTEDPSQNLSKSATALIPDSLENTLFERLLAMYGERIRRMLSISYRFNTKINEFPSNQLYDGKLVPDSSVADRKLSDLPGVEEDDELDEPVVFYDTSGLSMFERSDSSDDFVSESKVNENEAEICLSYVKYLTQHGVPQESIAVISPYNGQVNLITTLVKKDFPEIQVGSVDGYQGREADVVIISLVRSNEEGDVGFLKDMRRLNVAMTRPRRQLCVIGDSGTVKRGSAYLKSWMDWLEENADLRIIEDV